MDDLLTHDHISLLRIYTVRNAGHAFNRFQPFHQLIRLWKLFPINHQTHHQLPRIKSLSDQHMADKASVGLLLIRPDTKLLHKTFQNTQNLPILLHPQQTVLMGNDSVGPPRKNPVTNLPVFICSKRKLSLIPVPPGILHTYDRQKLGISLLP